MDQTFNCISCGLCCGPVPVTAKELKNIKKELNKKSFAEIQRLRSQKRDPLTCIFRDIEHKKCSIYSARPDICKMFGFYQGMKCENNPNHATRSHIEGHRRINRNTNKSPIAGVLSINIFWDSLLERGKYNESRQNCF